MIPVLKHKESSEKPGTFCYARKKRHAQRIMKLCQKDTEARLKEFSPAKLWNNLSMKTNNDKADYHPLNKRNN